MVRLEAFNEGGGYHRHAEAHSSEFSFESDSISYGAARG